MTQPNGTGVWSVSSFKYVLISHSASSKGNPRQPPQKNGSFTTTLHSTTADADVVSMNVRPAPLARRVWSSLGNLPGDRQPPFGGPHVPGRLEEAKRNSKRPSASHSSRASTSASASRSSRAGQKPRFSLVFLCPSCVSRPGETLDEAVGGGRSGRSGRAPVPHGVT